MATAGPTAPGPVTNDTGIGTLAWQNTLSNFIGCGGSFVQINDLDETETTNYLKTVGYGFAIPTGSTIDGVVFTASMKTGSTNQYAYVYGRLVRNNVIDTSQTRGGLQMITADPSVGTVTLGGPTDNWGGITVSDVNNANFGAALYLGGSTNNMYPSANCGKITVYYTPPVTVIPELRTFFI